MVEAFAAFALITGPGGISAAGSGNQGSMHYGFAVLAIASASLWVWPRRAHYHVVTAVLGVLGVAAGASYLLRLNAAQTVNALGIAALDRDKTRILSGAAMEVSGNITIATENFELSGSGVGGAGALRNVSGSNTLGGGIKLLGNTTISSDAGLLTLSGTGQILGSGSIPSIHSIRDRLN